MVRQPKAVELSRSPQRRRSPSSELQRSDTYSVLLSGGVYYTRNRSSRFSDRSSLQTRARPTLTQHDSASRGFGATLAANSCPNIRGNMGRNTIIGPGLFNADFSLFKNNRISKIS